MLSVRGLRKSFGERLVLDAVDLDVDRGERVALLGANGSGKTTLLRCILGTVTAESGEITVAGRPGGSRRSRLAIGASLAQERSFYLRMTGEQNLRFFARLRGLSHTAARREVSRLGEELELGEVLGKPAGQCSTGQLQQLAFARALLGEPPLILLDEPTRSLDEEARARLWGAVGRRASAAVVFATHLPSDVAGASSTYELDRR